MIDFNALQSAFKTARASFIEAELELGLTFSQIAFDTKDSEKRRRCTGLAREACDTAEHFIRDIPHEDLCEVVHLEPLLVRLKGKLQLLPLIP